MNGKRAPHAVQADAVHGGVTLRIGLDGQRLGATFKRTARPLFRQREDHRGALNRFPILIVHLDDGVHPNLLIADFSAAFAGDNANAQRRGLLCAQEVREKNTNQE